MFLDHLDASTAVLSNLVDVGTLPKPHADLCVAQTVGRTWSAFAVEAKLFLIEDGFEKFSLPLRKNRSLGSGVRPCLLGTAEVSDVLVGVFTPSTRAGRSRLLSPLRLPISPFPARAYSSVGMREGESLMGETAPAELRGGPSRCVAGGCWLDGSLLAQGFMESFHRKRFPVEKLE